MRPVSSMYEVTPSQMPTRISVPAPARHPGEEAWTEHRITASPEDCPGGVGQDGLPGYDFTWDSRRLYLGKCGTAIDGRRAAWEFWKNVAIKWPSATFTTRTLVCSPWEEVKK